MTDGDIPCDARGMEDPINLIEAKDRLRFARVAAGYQSASAAAEHLKIKLSTYRAHENGQNKFDHKYAKLYGEAFGVNPIWLLGFGEIEASKFNAEDPEVLKLAASNIPSAQKPSFIPAPQRMDMPLNLAVYGFAVGGTDDDGEFYMNGQIADYVRRPPGITNMRGVFGVYVCGDSMYPRFQARELVFATNAQTPAIGDDVVIELIRMNPESDDEADHAARGLIKRLKKRGPNKIVVEQFNPPRDIEFSRDEIKAIHRVLTNNDLYGS